MIISEKNQTWLITGIEGHYIGERQFCSEKEYKTTIPHPTVLQAVQDVLAEVGLCEPVKPKYEGDLLEIDGYQRTDAIGICTKYPSLVGTQVLIDGVVTRVEPWRRFEINNETWFEADDSTVFIKEQSHDPETI